jgi:hypothetical protein
MEQWNSAAGSLHHNSPIVLSRRGWDPRRLRIAAPAELLTLVVRFPSRGKEVLLRLIMLPAPTIILVVLSVSPAPLPFALRFEFKEMFWILPWKLKTESVAAGDAGARTPLAPGGMPEAGHFAADARPNRVWSLQPLRWTGVDLRSQAAIDRPSHPRLAKFEIDDDAYLILRPRSNAGAVNAYADTASCCYFDADMHAEYHSWYWSLRAVATASAPADVNEQLTELRVPDGRAGGTAARSRTRIDR